MMKLRTASKLSRILAAVVLLVVSLWSTLVWPSAHWHHNHVESAEGLDHHGHYHEHESERPGHGESGNAGGEKSDSHGHKFDVKIAILSVRGQLSRGANLSGSFVDHKSPRLESDCEGSFFWLQVVSQRLDDHITIRLTGRAPPHLS